MRSHGVKAPGETMCHLARGLRQDFAIAGEWAGLYLRLDLQIGLDDCARNATFPVDERAVAVEGYEVVSARRHIRRGPPLSQQDGEDENQRQETARDQGDAAQLLHEVAALVSGQLAGRNADAHVLL